MAKFNVDTPDVNARNQLGASKAASQPESDKSLEYLFQGIGKGFEGAVTTADNFMKEKIGFEVTDVVNTERQGFTQALEKLTKTPDVSSFGKQANDGGLLGTDAYAQAMPDEVADSEDTADTLNAAGPAGAGKISPTYLYQQYISKAKDLRSRYPGYAPYVDEQFKRVSGVDPANKYYESLVAIANQQQGSANKERTQATKLALQHADILPANTIDLINSGKMDTSGLYKQISPVLAKKAVIDARKASRDSDKGNEEDNAKITTDDLSTFATTKLNTLWNSVRVNNNLQTPAQIQKAVNASMTGTGAKIDPNNAITMAQAIMAQQNEAKAKLWEYATTEDPSDPRRRTRLAQLGTGASEKYKKMEEDLMLPYDHLIEQLVGKNRPDLAAATGMRSQALMDDAQGVVIQDPKWAPYLGLMGAFTKNAGPQAGALIMQKSMVEGKLDTALGSVFHEDNMKQWVQPDYRTDKTPWTMSQTLNNAKNRDPNGNVYKPENYRDIYGVLKYVTDPTVTDEGKVNLLRSAFDPNNSGFLKNFAKDTTAPNGQKVEGRYSVWQTMTNKSVTDEVVRLSRTDPTIMRNYLNWSQEEFGQQLLKPAIMDLNSISDRKDLKIGWDPDNHKLIFDRVGRPGSSMFTRGTEGYTGNAEYERWKNSVTNLNDALPNLSHIAESAGINVDAYLVDRLMNEGWHPKDGTIPGDIMNAILAPSVKSLSEKRAKQTKLNRATGKYEPTDPGVEIAN